MDCYPNKTLLNLMLIVFFVAFVFLTQFSAADVDPETEVDGYKRPPKYKPPKYKPPKYKPPHYKPPYYKPPPKYKPPSTLENEPETEADEVPQGDKKSPYYKPPPKHKPPPYKPPRKPPHKPPYKPPKYPPTGN